jgi:hypothetical protein
MGFSWQNKVSDKKLEEIFLEIPVKEKGDFDLGKQKEISEKYKTITKIKKRLKSNYDKIINSKIQLGS